MYVIELSRSQKVLLLFQVLLCGIYLVHYIMKDILKQRWFIISGLIFLPGNKSAAVSHTFMGVINVIASISNHLSLTVIICIYKVL